VEPVWIGKRQGLQNRAPPVIPHLRWNHHFDCVSGDAFTNNSSEGKLYFFIFYDCSGFGSTCYMYGSGFCSGTFFSPDPDTDYALDPDPSILMQISTILILFKDSLCLKMM
jgi:hypothetical protein